MRTAASIAVVAFVAFAAATLSSLAACGKQADKRDPCKLLTADEASQLIGSPLKKTEPTPGTPDMACNYFGETGMVAVQYYASGVDPVNTPRQLMPDGIEMPGVGTRALHTPEMDMMWVFANDHGAWVMGMGSSKKLPAPEVVQKIAVALAARL